MNDRMLEAAAARAAAGLAPDHMRPRERRYAEVETINCRRSVLGTMQVARDRGESDREISPVSLPSRAAGEPVDGPGVTGLASRVETPYEMWDMYGPYTEIVDRAAFTDTLTAEPLVEFALNHGRAGGPPMAHTRNSTLLLWLSQDGLEYDASVDPRRSDVTDMLLAIERGDLAESSFKFRIDAGVWSPDFTQYRITRVDLNRGDVSSVNFGANPETTTGLRELEPVKVVRRTFVLDQHDLRRLPRV